MAADLHIHIFQPPMTEDDWHLFCSSHLGSKWFNPGRNKYDSGVYDVVSDMPGIWIGEVSWLKAALFSDAETFVPGPIEIIAEAIGEDLPILDSELTAKILAAFDQPNTTQYSLTSKNKVESFLAQHQGKQVFTVSW